MMVNIQKKRIMVEKKANGMVLHQDEEEIINILCNDGTEIQTIYHLADIHIQRFSDRHEEYLKVFENLCEEIKKDTKNALICICGDILHDKSQLSAPQMVLCKTLFINLSKMCTLIIIPGNHDLAPQNNCIDALTPILMNLNTKHPIHLLLNDENYIYNNICFGVTTMFAKKITPIYEKNKKMVKVGLYHGTLDGCMADNGFKIGTSDHWNYKDFKKHYDVVLLGDIHKQSFLDEEEKVGYSGSLLQTRWGESLKKGVLKWDIGSLSAKFIRIYNEIGMVKLRASEHGIDYGELKENGKLKENLNDCQNPKILNIRLEYENITVERAEKHVEELKKQYNVKSISLTRKTHSDVDIITVGKKKGKKKIVDVNDNNVVIDLIEKHMRSETEKKHSDETIRDVKKKVSHILESMEFNYSNQVKNFTLKTLRFKNFFNYDEEESTIDYTKMENIVGLIGKNYIGKSTCGIDVLLYSIYGITQRGDKADIIRIGAKETATFIEFEINSDSYSVQRTRKRQSTKKTKKETVEEVVLKKNKKNISRDTVTETNILITQIVCEYDDFINTSMVPQQCSHNFIDLPAKDQKNLISCLLKFNVFSEIVSKAKSEKCINDLWMCNERKGFEKKKKGYDKFEASESLRKQIQIKEEELSESDRFLAQLTERSDRMLRDSIEFASKKEEFKDLDLIIVNDQKIIKTIQMIESKIMINENKIKDKKNESNALNEILKNNERLLKNITEKKEQCDETEKKIAVNQIQINELNQRYEELLSRRVSERILEHFNVSDIDYDAEKKVNILMKEHEVELNEMIEFFNSELLCDKLNQTKQEVEPLHGLYIRAIDNKSKIIESMRMKKDEMNTLNNKSNILKNHIYDKNCKYCMSYPMTGEKIKCQDQITIANKIIETYEKELLDCEENLLKLKIGEDKYCQWIESEQWNSCLIKKINKMTDDLNQLRDKIKKSNELVKNYQMYQKIGNETRVIDEECAEIKKRIKEFNALNSKGLKESNDHQTNEMNTKNLILIKQVEIEKIINQIEKMNNQTSDLRKEHSEQTQIFEKINKFTELCKKYKNINDMMKKNKNDLNEEKKRNQDTNNQLIILGENLKEAERRCKKYEERENDNKIIIELIETIDKKGLIDNILSSTVMPRIESNVNELLDQVSEFRIGIEYENGNIKIHKLKGGDVTNIRTVSGYERFVCNMCFKLALNTGFNNFLKTKFLIIDEAFTSCDDDSIRNKLPSLFNYIRDNYKFAIVITHEERIKSNFDEHIEVIKLLNGNSHISC